MKSLIFAAALAGTLTGIGLANENPSFQTPTYAGPMSAAEKAFVASIQTDLNQRFPTAADAEKAGYIRYTAEDETGAISYANLAWQSTDSRHPSQLRYDKNGKLLGADFSRLKTGSAPPKLWGIDPGRWWEFDRHVHYVTKDASGTLHYGLYVADDDFVTAGGSLAHPDAAALVAMGRVKNASDVVTVFSFPAVWDVVVWVKPNPNGAFAYKNPLVKP